MKIIQERRSLLPSGVTRQPSTAAKMEITVIRKIRGVERRSFFKRVARR